MTGRQRLEAVSRLCHVRRAAWRTRPAGDRFFAKWFWGGGAWRLGCSRLARPRRLPRDITRRNGMRKLVALPLVVAAVLALPPCPAPACSLCSMIASQPTLRQVYEGAKLVVLGTASKPRGNADGTGVADFTISKVLKDDPWRGNRKAVVLTRYVRDTDSNTYVVFCNVPDGKLDPYRGQPVRSAGLLPYLEGTRAAGGKDRT